MHAHPSSSVARSQSERGLSRSLIVDIFLNDRVKTDDQKD